MYLDFCKLPNKIIWPEKLRFLGIISKGKFNFKSITYKNLDNLSVRGIYIQFSDISHVNINNLNCQIKQFDFIGIPKTISVLHIIEGKNINSFKGL